MTSAESTRWLSDLTAPLASKFGNDLMLCRDENRVEWSYHGETAVIELLPQGTIQAKFVERPSFDSVSSSHAAAVYRPRFSYALNPASCERMVSDMVEFFSGVREPRFVFSEAYTLPGQA